MFFLDHLKESPFPIHVDTTWDTNVYEGMYWGLKILQKDLQLRGNKRENSQAFILISDGQVWSGSMEEVFKIIGRVAPVYVIGVGTTAGGIIPEPAVPPKSCYDEAGQEICVDNPPKSSVPVHASIDRGSLRKIADTTGGQYFELGIASDQQIALSIVNAVRRRGLSSSKEEIFKELYWWFILAAAICLILAWSGRCVGV